MPLKLVYVNRSGKRGELVFRKSSIAIITSIAVSLAISAAASAAEIELAGIKLGRSAFSIIQKYGDPSEVRVGGSSHAAEQSTGGGMEMPPGLGIGGEAPPPGFGGPSLGGPVAEAPHQQTSKPMGREVTWIYRFAKNKTLEFIIDAEGRVLQIAAYGVEWPGLRTSKGTHLGSTYKEVILAYGFPETHERAGIEMVLKYANSHRVAFTLVGNQVVGITIAFMD